MESRSQFETYWMIGWPHFEKKLFLSNQRGYFMDCYQQNLTSITFVLYSALFLKLKLFSSFFLAFNRFDRIDLRSNHGLLTRDVGVRVEMWLQLDVSRSDVGGYTPGVHTRRFRVVCLLESACNLDLSYNRFQWCKCTDRNHCLCMLRYAEKDYSRNLGSTITNNI